MQKYTKYIRTYTCINPLRSVKNKCFLSFDFGVNYELLLTGSVRFTLNVHRWNMIWCCRILVLAHSSKGFLQAGAFRSHHRAQKHKRPLSRQYSDIPGPPPLGWLPWRYRPTAPARSSSRSRTPSRGPGLWATPSFGFISLNGTLKTCYLKSLYDIYCMRSDIQCKMYLCYIRFALSMVHECIVIWRISF